MELKDVPLFEGFDASELESVQKCLHEKHFSKGDLLFFEGNACQRIFIIKKGRVKLFQTAEAQREQILQSLSAGETCACHPGNASWFCNSTAQAMDDCDVWFFSPKDFGELLKKSSKLSQKLNQIFAQKMQCFSRLIEELSLKGVKERLIKFLLDMP
jgi:CRP-like cAMP-binding protein